MGVSRESGSYVPLCCPRRSCLVAARSRSQRPPALHSLALDADTATCKHMHTQEHIIAPA